MGNRRQLLAAYYRRLRMKSPGETLRALLHPGRLREHLGKIATGAVHSGSNPYRPSLSRRAEAEFCGRLLSRPAGDAEAAFDELEQDAMFLEDLRARYAGRRPEWPDGLDVGRFRVWYALVRLKQPDTIIETGVHDGLSSALILRAIERNGHGELISIDLPSMDLPAGTQPGWLVPQALRSRWRLHLGDARKLLPEIVEQLHTVDVFIHDSDHERGHREFEFRTAKRAAGPGSLLLSDDDADDLLDTLAAEWAGDRTWVRCALPDGDSAHLGGIRL